MALFSFGKKKKKDDIPAAMPPPPDVPVDQIMTMKEQGYAADQIIENLQNQGYNSSQINDAINQANMSQQMPSQPGPMPQQPYQMPEQYPDMGPSPMQQSPPMAPPQDYPSPTPVTEKERIEELAEAIIDEKWNELVKDINKVIDWKEKTETRINKIEQQLLDIRSGLESLHKSLIAKITDYDKNIENVGVEIKAMEKVFQKVLPSLTENVNRLERLGKKASSGK
jgi:hypothetical protein